MADSMVATLIADGKIDEEYREMKMTDFSHCPAGQGSFTGQYVLSLVKDDGRLVENHEIIFSTIDFLNYLHGSDYSVSVRYEYGFRLISTS